jgi:cytochrome c oxidase assembly protein subunit 15
VINTIKASKLDRSRLFLCVGTITLLSFYLVILAGSIVRATGSGMGCPDWPKCFGLYIPPLSPSEIEYHPGEHYAAGRMIIVNDTLWHTPISLIAPAQFTRTQWDAYSQHNYAKFYVLHTWIEYINRLLGVLSGLFLAILFFISLFRFKKDRLTTVLLFLGMLVLGFVGWLGKVVVDSNLTPYKISLHMFSALVMVAIVIYVNSRVRRQTDDTTAVRVSKAVGWGLVGLLLFTLVQIYIGTQIRQQVDVLYKTTENTNRESWIAQLNSIYTLHKLIAIGIVFFHVLLYVLLRKKMHFSSVLKGRVFAIVLILVVEYTAGVVMHRFAIPNWIQPLHLSMATFVFGLQFALLINMRFRDSIEA